MHHFLTRLQLTSFWSSFWKYKLFRQLFIQWQWKRNLFLLLLLLVSNSFQVASFTNIFFKTRWLLRLICHRKREACGFWVDWPKMRANKCWFLQLEFFSEFKNFLKWKFQMRPCYNFEMNLKKYFSLRIMYFYAVPECGY